MFYQDPIIAFYVLKMENLNSPLDIVRKTTVKNNEIAAKEKCSLIMFVRYKNFMIEKIVGDI